MPTDRQEPDEDVDPRREGSRVSTDVARIQQAVVEALQATLPPETASKVLAAITAKLQPKANEDPEEDDESKRPPRPPIGEVEYDSSVEAFEKSFTEQVADHARFLTDPNGFTNSLGVKAKPVKLFKMDDREIEDDGTPASLMTSRWGREGDSRRKGPRITHVP